MTYEESCNWLQRLLVSGACPYKNQGIDIREFPTYRKGLIIPCAKLNLPDRYEGGLFLTSSGDIVIWKFQEHERDYIVSEILPEWRNPSIANNWRMTSWNLALRPWCVSNWLKEHGLT